MPRCEDSWRRNGDIEVGVRATCDDQSQFYALTYAFHSNDPNLPVRPGGSFDSSELATGVEWRVPKGYRCLFQLLTTGNRPVDTEITLNGDPAACHPGSHCQGACQPAGPAGIAGDWAVTAARRPS